MNSLQTIMSRSLVIIICILTLPFTLLCAELTIYSSLSSLTAFLSGTTSQTLSELPGLLPHSKNYYYNI